MLTSCEREFWRRNIGKVIQVFHTFTLYRRCLSIIVSVTSFTDINRRIISLNYIRHSQTHKCLFISSKITLSSHQSNAIRQIRFHNRFPHHTPNEPCMCLLLARGLHSIHMFFLSVHIALMNTLPIQRKRTQNITMPFEIIINTTRGTWLMIDGCKPVYRQVQLYFFKEPCLNYRERWCVRNCLQITRC